MPGNRFLRSPACICIMKMFEVIGAAIVQAIQEQYYPKIKEDMQDAIKV